MYMLTGRVGTAIPAGNGERVVKKTITFSPPFATPPGMTVAISALDVAHDRNLRIDVYPDDIRTDGATLYFKTWADTQIYGVTATWAAFGT